MNENVASVTSVKNHMLAEKLTRDRDGWKRKPELFLKPVMNQTFILPGSVHICTTGSSDLSP